MLAQDNGPRLWPRHTCWTVADAREHPEALWTGIRLSSDNAKGLLEVRRCGRKALSVDSGQGSNRHPLPHTCVMNLLQAGAGPVHLDTPRREYRVLHPRRASAVPTMAVAISP